MTKCAALLLSGFLSACPPAFGLTIGGVEIPDTLALPDSEHGLLLNGAGVREKFFMDIYVGALYLPTRTTDSRAILADTGAATVLMHFVYSEVGKDRIVGGWNDGLRDNLSAAELRAIAERLDSFNSLFRTVHRDDVIRIDYNPAIGTEVRINDEWRGTVKGNDFFRALLRIWLGDDPVSASLKKAMLGRD
jgi:hypothetical protein